MRPFISNTLTLVFLALPVLLSVSCNVGRRSVSASTIKTESKRDTIQKPVIIFLTYSMKKDKQGGYELNLLKKHSTEGKLKMRDEEIANPVAGDLMYKIMDDRKIEIKQDYIPNPLKRDAEYVQDDGSLARTLIELDSAQFFLRFQLESAGGSVVLERYNGEGSRNTHLLTTEL